MHLSLGEKLLISAIGSGVGLAALQIAKTMGCSVIGSSRCQDKLDHAKAWGLDHSILVKNSQFASAVKEIFSDGVNVILELVGGDYLVEDIECSALNGRIALVGLLGGRKANIDLGKVLSQAAIVKRYYLKSTPSCRKNFC